MIRFVEELCEGGRGGVKENFWVFCYVFGWFVVFFVGRFEFIMNFFVECFRYWREENGRNRVEILVEML